jgi:hypothetical protein
MGGANLRDVMKSGRYVQLNQLGRSTVKTKCQVLFLSDRLASDYKIRL